MIANKAYAKNKFVYRAYFNGMLIWDYGTYTAGSMSAGATGSAMPTMEELTPVLMQAEATLSGSGTPDVVEFEPYQAHAEASLDGYASPRAADVVHGNGVASATIQAVGAPSTYSQVFGTGQAVDTIDAQAMPRAVEIEYGAGVADAGIIASLCPTVDEFLQLVMNAGATIEGSATPQTQEPEKIVASTAAELTATCCAEAVPVHHVTFMHNGVELFQASVIDGYDCPDPVATEAIGTPTKAMTPQYTYEYSGWTLAEGGAADSTALTNITADTVIYAAFTASIRSYMITLYDDDGTHLQTEYVAYGSTPSYVPSKDGYAFDDWYPDMVPVTEDASYYARWMEKISFASADWATITELSESGKASRHFAVGDTKTIAYTGTSGTINVMIAGFDHDDLADGSGKAGLSLIVTKCTFPKTAWASKNEAITRYSDSTLHSTLNSTILSYLPSDLQNVIKAVSKKYDYTITSGYSPTIRTVSAKLWALAYSEIVSMTGHENKHSFLGNQYDCFASSLLTTSKLLPSNGDYVWLRSLLRWSSSYSTPDYYYKNASGLRLHYSSTTTSAYKLVFGFCI